MRLLLLIVGLAQGFLGFSTAATLSSNGSSADVTAKIKAASTGDTVTVPAGTFTWNVVSLDKGITLQGAGASSTTVIGLPSLNISGSSFRVTGINFFDGGPTNALLIDISGNHPGLLDHCTFTGTQSPMELIHNLGVGETGWSDDIHPGSADAVYVEDCTFTNKNQKDPYFWGSSGLQSYYGARTVVRHCAFNYCQLDQHGTAGMVGARWFEFYDNTFKVPDAGNQSSYIVLRGGSGVVFNNTATGNNYGAGSIDLYDENGGSSPAYLGRGINKNPSPVYIWANSSSMHVNASSSNVKADRDYFNSSTQPGSMKRWQLSSDNANTTYAYKPYTYPHPMAGGGPAPTPNPTATPAPTATPSPTPPSTKFKVGDKVQTNPNSANIRSTPAGELVGTQPMGTTGTVTDGPDWGALSGSSGVFWWNIDFPTGADGWVGEDNLVKADGPVPTPTPAPTATPNPTPTPTQTWEKWIEDLNNWVRAHPPYPDQR